MKSLFQYYRRETILMLFLLAALVFLIASCVPATESPIISPKLGAALAQIEKGGQFTAPPTPTPVLFKALKPEQVEAGLPADIAATFKTANTGNAKAIALKYGCAGCHSLDPNVKLTGPTWFHLGDTAGNRVPGQSPALYVYTSITNPSAFVVPDYPDNVMPKDFAQKMSKQEIADLMAYILSQHQ